MRELNEFSFEEWVVAIFDLPVLDEPYPDDCISPDIGDECKYPAIAIDYVTRLFENPTFLLDTYSDKQIEQSLRFLLHNMYSGYLWLLSEKSVPWEKRQRCIESMYTLFEQVFAVRCVPQPTKNVFYDLCFMWFDSLPVVGYLSDQPEIDHALVDVMARILTLDNDKCRESAMHGLNHQVFHAQEHVHTVIANFLPIAHTLSPELHIYALHAIGGHLM